MSDPLHTLVQAARRHDESAWDQLFRQHQLRLFAYARGLTGDREAAFDIVQDSFVRAVAHLGSLRDNSKFPSWLFGIAHQRCLQHFRDSRRDAAVFGDGADGGAQEDTGDDPREALLGAEGAQALYALIDRLPLPQRSALLLHVVGGFSLEEIATVAAVPLGTVKSRLFQAKRALRELIGKEAP